MRAVDIPPEVLDAVKGVELTLLDVPGINGVGIGMRESEGELFPDELAVRILVDDASAIPEEVPRQIAGVDVSIIEGRCEPLVSPDFTKRYRDLHGGIHIRNPGRSEHGTLGAIVQDASATGDGQLLGLSCFHVVGDNGTRATSGATFPFSVWQPSNPPIGVMGGTPPRPDDNIGKVQRARFPNTPVFALLGSDTRVGFFDAAVFTLDDALQQPDSQNRRTISRSIMGQDEQQPNLADAITDTALPVMGMDVSKRGAATRVTHGRVSSPYFALPWLALGQDPRRRILASFEIVVDTALTQEGIFCLRGDSGSVVLRREGERVLPTAVGLLWGGLVANGTVDGRLGYMTPIQFIEEELEISIVFA
jgi:hypothetical protein